MKLSNRLQVILDLIPEDSILADIGSDHGLLPVAALQSGKVKAAIAGEVNQGPLDAAARQVAEAGLKDKIAVRLGDGLAVVEPGEVSVVTIAGMGGSLISSILENGIDRLQGVKQLILQPNVGEEFVRSWLLQHNWVITYETIIEEDKKIYEIISAVPEQGQIEITNEQLYQTRKITSQSEKVITLNKDLLLRMGPYLIEDPNEVFFKKWFSEIAKLERIKRSVASSKLESAAVKSQELSKEIEQIQEVLSCLQKGKPSFN